MVGVDFASYAGPGDRDLRSTLADGFNPVSNIGEIVQNAYVDPHEFSSLAASLTQDDVQGGNGGGPGVFETRPAFHEWATVQPGMLLVARKRRATRMYRGAETAQPVIACAAMQKKGDEKNWFFAGVARSKSVREADDGIGPKQDEFFTCALGGMVTMLNNSGTTIMAGDSVEWTFSPAKPGASVSGAKRQKLGPRRICLKVCSPHSSRLVGRALSMAKSGEPIDVLIAQ